MKTEKQTQTWVLLYLLPLLKFQLDTGFDAVARVLIRLLQREFHEVFVVRSCQVPADKNYYICQYLGGLKRKRRQGIYINILTEINPSLQWKIAAVMYFAFVCFLAKVNLSKSLSN